MRIKTEILGVKAIVPPRIVNKVKILKKNKQTTALGTCISLSLLENTSRLKMMLLLIEVTTQSFNSPPSTNS